LLEDKLACGIAVLGFSPSANIQVVGGNEGYRRYKLIAPAGNSDDVVVVSGLLV
jgi:hypothetical protein